MNNFHEKEIAKLSSHVHEVLGDRLNTFYRQRFVALDRYLEGLLEDHDGCADSISNAEIEGAFEMEYSPAHFKWGDLVIQCFLANRVGIKESKALTL